MAEKTQLPALPIEVQEQIRAGSARMRAVAADARAARAAELQQAQAMPTIVLDGKPIGPAYLRAALLAGRSRQMGEDEEMLQRC